MTLFLNCAVVLAATGVFPCCNQIRFLNRCSVNLLSRLGWFTSKTLSWNLSKTSSKGSGGFFKSFFFCLIESYEKSSNMVQLNMVQLMFCFVWNLVSTNQHLEFNFGWSKCFNALSTLEASLSICHSYLIKFQGVNSTKCTSIYTAVQAVEGTNQGRMHDFLEENTNIKEGGSNLSFTQMFLKTAWKLDRV